MNTNANIKQVHLQTSALVTLVLAALLATMLAALVYVPAAWANKEVDAPVQVSDDIVRVHVNKLDSDTRAYVEGASMAIIEKDTGTVVDEWVTGTSTHMNEKALNVGVTYILREISAPEGYKKVEDTEFVVNEIEGEGLTLLTGSAELFDSYKLNLYDEPLPVEKEKVITETRENDTPNVDTPNDTPRNDTPNNRTSTTTKPSPTAAPQTGDETPLSLIVVLVIAGIACIALLQIPKRRLR